MPVTVLFVLITVAAIVANVGAASAGFTQADFALANSARVGVPSSWLPALGTLKIAGAAGLLLRLLGVRYIGITAAAGLVLFFLGSDRSTPARPRAPPHHHHGRLLPAGSSVAGGFRRALRTGAPVRRSR